MPVKLPPSRCRRHDVNVIAPRPSRSTTSPRRRHRGHACVGPLKPRWDPQGLDLGRGRVAGHQTSPDRPTAKGSITTAPHAGPCRQGARPPPAAQLLTPNPRSCRPPGQIQPSQHPARARPTCAQPPHRELATMPPPLHALGSTPPLHAPTTASPAPHKHGVSTHQCCPVPALDPSGGERMSAAAGATRATPRGTCRRRPGRGAGGRGDWRGSWRLGFTLSVARGVTREGREFVFGI